MGTFSKLILPNEFIQQIFSDYSFPDPDIGAGDTAVVQTN